jgi:hypothetical protein
MGKHNLIPEASSRRRREGGDREACSIFYTILARMSSNTLNSREIRLEGEEANREALLLERSMLRKMRQPEMQTE